MKKETKRGNSMKKKISILNIASAAASKSLPSCLTLCDPIDSSPPGYAIPGILQARVLEWAATAISIYSLYRL